MYTVLKVFAKKDTTEKVVMNAPNEFRREIMIALNKKFGGQWLCVDDVYPGEFIHFSDNQKYKGFNPEIDRYSDAIKKLDQ